MKQYLPHIIVLVAAVILSAVFARPVQNVTNQVLGATATLDGVDNAYVRINGQSEWHGRIPMTATSSVVCSFPNPYNATSTVRFPITASVTNNPIGSQSLYISTSTTNAASSTVAWSNAIAVGTSPSGFAFNGNMATGTSLVGTNDANILPGVSATGGTSNYVIGPTERLNIKIATSTAGVFSSYLSGACSAVIQKLN